MTTSAITWTADRVETLRKLWREGMSARQIARSLGHGVTRNAVIGKVHRLGLTGRSAPRAPGAERPDRRREPRGRIAHRPKPRRALSAPPAPDPMLPAIGLVSVLGVGRGQCRWPMGDPRADDFCLCGRFVVRGAYCAPHADVAYRPTARNHLVELAGRAALA